MHVVRCMAHVACRFPLHAACRPLHFPCCALHVAWCLLHSFRWCLARCPLRVVCGIAVCRIVSAARWLLSVFLWPAPVPHVAWCVLSVAWSHVASRLVHVLRCESSVACCMTHVPSRIVSLVCRLPHLACHMLDVAKRAFSVASCLLSGADPILARRLLHVVCCNVAERHGAVAHAAHRGGASQLSASVAGKTRYRPRCACVRACVRACGWVASVRCVVVGCCACVGGIRA